MLSYILINVNRKRKTTIDEHYNRIEKPILVFKIMYHFKYITETE